MKDFFKTISPKFYISLSGILLGFTVIFAKIGILAYLALIPLALVVLNRAESGEYRLKKAYADGFVFFISYYLVAFHWFAYFYPLDFTGIPKGAALGVVFLAWFGLSALQGVFAALFFVLIALFAKTDIYKKRPILMPFFVAAMFAVNEWSQTFTWAGVPWARIAISQTEMPIMMQTASLFGSYFLTFIVVLFNFLVAYAIRYSDKRKLYTSIAACVIALNLVCGTVLYFIPTKDEERQVKVASIQGNLLSQTNYDKSIGDIYVIYENLTRRAAEEGAEIIVWPENVISSDLNAWVRPEGSGWQKIDAALSKLAVETGTSLITGHFVYENEENKYNSLSIFYPDGSSNINVYSKIRLVPFGEFVPMRSLVELIAPSLAEINVFVMDSTPGDKSTVFDSSSGEDAVKISALICFDSIYEELGINSARAGAEMFIIPSNDSWFYDSRALNMHHSQNILRAVEQGKYTVNCGNTGITSIVSDKGEIVNDIPIYTEDYVLDTVYASSYRTLYSYIGNLFVYVCVALTVATIVWDSLSKARKNKE